MKNYVKICNTYQLNKLLKTNYKKLPKKDNILDIEPQKHIYIDTISLWEISVTKYTKGK